MVLQLPGTPPATSSEGGGGHCPCLPTPYSLGAHCCQHASNLRSRLRQPAPLPRSDCVCLYSWCPPAFCLGPARHLPHHIHFSFGRGGGGARVAQVYPKPQDSAPQGMAPTGCHYETPAPIATQPVSTPRFPSPRPNHRKPRSKDIRYDGRSSWKASLHKFVRLARIEQWTEVDQHDQFC